MAYQAPVEIILSELKTKQENAIFTAIQECGVSVDKDELLKALAYDRRQYEKGYADGSNSNQWISADEPPKTDEDVLCWYEYFRYGDYNRMFQTYGIGHYHNGFWSGEVSHGTNSRVIAWQSLPQPPKTDGKV